MSYWGLFERTIASQCSRNLIENITAWLLGKTLSSFYDCRGFSKLPVRFDSVWFLKHDTSPTVRMDSSPSHYLYGIPKRTHTVRTKKSTPIHNPLHTPPPTVKPVFKTTWEIGTTWELRKATSVPRSIHYIEMDLKIRPLQNSGQFLTVPWVSLIPRFHCILHND